MTELTRLLAVAIDNLSHGIGLEAIFTAILAVVSYFVGIGAKKYVWHREKSQSLILKKNGTEIDLPSVQDPDSLRKRISALFDISPRLAVLYGWNLAEATIIDRLSVTDEKVLSTVPDIVALAANLPDIDEDALQRLSELRKFRNLIAHSPGLAETENNRLTEVAKEIYPLLMRLRPRFGQKAEEAPWRI
ncbi:hypothetical protein [Caballeronia sp. LjRoot31]|uniref:hypothetical protein n=1 Tax=Caballeronia sp. LjRoot31 TaxID=3342324 RepID=UPI003ED09DCA